MALRALAGGRVFGETHGDDPPAVVALHGWQRTAADLAGVLAGFDALAIDLPGFGSSPPPPEPWGASDYAEALAPVFAALDQPPVVLAHSFGGRVAVHLARRVPIASLGLVGVPLIRPPGGRRAPVGYRVIRRLHDRNLISHARMEAARQKYGSADYRSARGVMRGVLVRVVNESYESELDDLSIPVRLLWGAEDTAAPVEQARAAYDRLRARGADVTLDVLDGVGHDVHRERPDVVRELLTDLVAQR